MEIDSGLQSKEGLKGFYPLKLLQTSRLARSLYVGLWEERKHLKFAYIYTLLMLYFWECVSECVLLGLCVCETEREPRGLTALAVITRWIEC